MSKCDKTMESKIVKGHTHNCVGGHSPSADHLCGDCGRRWQKKEEDARTA